MSAATISTPSVLSLVSHLCFQVDGNVDQYIHLSTLGHLHEPVSALPHTPHTPSAQVDDSYVDQYISISQFPLSAAYALGRITNALEHKWGIV